MARSKRHTELSPTRIQALQRSARRLASGIGTFVAARHRPTGLDMQRKGEGDFVTAVDLAAERRLRREIAATWPDHGILGEEAAAHRVDAEFVWVLDPIDGTSNFGRGLPTYAVSVACLHRGLPVAAAVHCMPEDVTYHAGRGAGAFRGRQRLRLRPARLGDHAILGVQWHRQPGSLAYLDALVATGGRVRNLGCTVVQLCDVAAGRLDANVQEQGKLWDFAAAALVVIEAGGRFTDWRGDAIFPAEPDPSRHHPSIAAHPSIHGDLCRLLGPHQTRIVVPSR